MWDANTNERNLTQIVRSNDVDTFTRTAPWSNQTCIRELYGPMVADFQGLCNALQHEYDSLWDEGDGDKEFVMKCKGHELYQGLFDMFKFQVSAREMFSFCHQKRYLKLIKDVRMFMNK
jgi:hypothetical protein